MDLLVVFHIFNSFDKYNFNTKFITYLFFSLLAFYKVKQYNFFLHGYFYIKLNLIEDKIVLKLNKWINE